MPGVIYSSAKTFLSQKLKQGHTDETGCFKWRNHSTKKSLIIAKDIIQLDKLYLYTRWARNDGRFCKIPNVINFSFIKLLLTSIIELVFDKIKCGNQYFPPVMSVFNDAFLKAFLDVGLHFFPHCYVDLGDFFVNSFLQIVQCSVLMFIYTCLEVFPQEVNTWTNQGTGRDNECQKTYKWGGYRRESEEHPLMVGLCGPLPHPAETTHVG